LEHDDALVRRCLAADQDACAELVDQYSRMVGTIIWRTTGDREGVADLTQETFLRVFRGLAYFDSRAKLSTWICTVAHRVAIDAYRASSRQPADSRREAIVSLASAVDSLPSSDSGPEDAAAASEMDRVINAAIRRLPEKYRLPLVYAAIDELDYSMIAAMLNVPIGTVQTLVFRAKRLLKADVASVLGLPSREG